MAKKHGETQTGRCHAGTRNGAPQLRATRRDGLTKARREAFLESLAENCNVVMAAKAAGTNKSSVYSLRRRDSRFRLAWAEALKIGYERLELAMLGRAIDGTEEPKFQGREEVAKVRRYNDAVGLKLLQMHRGSVLEAQAMEAGAGPDAGELRERIARKLERLRKRMEKEGA